MTAIATAYTRLILGLAVIGGLLLAGIFVGIIVDVTLRTIGLQPLQWYSAFAEYSLLYVAMLGAPWLVRAKGHVVVESLTLALPFALRKVVARFAYLTCVALCLLFVWYGGEKTISAWMTGELDLRSIDMPKWLLYVSFPIGFGLSAVEFTRYLLGFDTYYTGEVGSAESL